MYLIELNNKTLLKCLKENRYVLVSMYQNDCIVCEMMEGVLHHVCQKIKDDMVIAISKKECLVEIINKKWSHHNIIPNLFFFVDEELVGTLSGFRRASQVIDFVHQYM